MKKSTRKPSLRLNRDDLHHLGSLITYDDQGQERCLGYLMHFEDRGVYEPNFGRIDVTAVEAQTHNQALSLAEIQGLDAHCEVGQGALFYPAESALPNGSIRITTWVGDPVADATRVGRRLSFCRHGKTFVGRGKPGEAVFFKRTE